MIKEIPFEKMHGAGNDFILIDNRPVFFNGGEYDVFSRLCRRSLGIGADGLMLLENWTENGCTVRYYNSNGRPGTMCGNGARCAAYFFYQKNQGIKTFVLKMGSHYYPAEILSDRKVKVVWETEPKISSIPEIESVLSPEFSRALFIDSGSPHLIIEAEISLEKIDIQGLGAYYRNHTFFSPEGTNVNFVRFHKDKILIRTFERGVEAETLACGTGSLAAAVAGHFWKKTSFPVDIHTRGGILRVGRLENQEYFWLEGPVQPVFTGSFLLDALKVMTLL